MIPEAIEAKISPGALHLWRVRVRKPGPGRKILEACLSDEEMARAARLIRQPPRDALITSRGALRVILGHYLDLDPALILFEAGPHGKPGLAPPQGGTGLRFNISHSDDLILLAFTRHTEVGVDVERIRPQPRALQLARRFFSPLESQSLEALPEDLHEEAFFLCWTRKEAMVKATGEGLFRPLDSFDVSLTPGEPARLISIDRSREKAKNWWMEGLDPTPGFAGAIVRQGGPPSAIEWRSLKEEGVAEESAPRNRKGV